MGHVLSSPTETVGQVCVCVCVCVGGGMGRVAGEYVYHPSQIMWVEWRGSMSYHPPQILWVEWRGRSPSLGWCPVCSAVSWSVSASHWMSRTQSISAAWPDLQPTKIKVKKHLKTWSHMLHVSQINPRSTDKEGTYRHSFEFLVMS